MPVRPATAPSRPRLLTHVPAGSRSLGPDVATAGPRCVATLVDALIVGGGLAALLSPALLLDPEGSATSALGGVLGLVLLGLLALLAAAAYHVYFWGWRGATPGQRLLGLEVHARGGERPIGVRAAVVRWLGWALSAAALGLGFLPILLGTEGLHDRLAGTRVVRRARG